MLLHEIIKNIDKSPSNSDDVIWNLEIFENECAVTPLYSISQDENNQRIHCYWIAKHICTDRFVGVRAYFLDDVFVCYSIQPSRKANQVVVWMDGKSRSNVRAYLNEIIEKEELEPVADLNTQLDFGDGYKVNYTEQLNDISMVIYKGEQHQFKPETNRHSLSQEVMIRKNDDHDYFCVNIREVNIPWNIKKD